MERRQDTATSSALNIGIDLDATKGCTSAWVFLMSKHIPHSLILRVLAGPENRRARPIPPAVDILAEASAE